MPNPDLLIAQLRRRNRIMLAGMLAALAMIAIGSGLVILDATTGGPPAPPTDTKSSDAPKKMRPPTRHLPAVNKMFVRTRLTWLTQLTRLN